MPPSAESSLAYALDYHGDGITVLPLRPGDKRPSVEWKEYQERPQREDELPDLFGDDRLNVGVLGGSTSDGLLILDHDRPEDSIQLHKSSIYNYLIEQAPVVKTRRGFHIWVKTPIPVLSSKAEAYGIDVLGERKYAVAPPSRVLREHHRDQLYLFTGKKILPILRLDNEQFAELRDLLSLKTALDDTNHGGDLTDATGARLDAPGAFYGLGMGVWNRLRSPESVGNRSEVEAGIVLRAVGIGWTFEDVYELFRRHAGPGSKFREKLAQGYGESYLRILYASAERKVLQDMTARERALNDALDLLQRKNPFSGRSAATDRAVLTAILEIQREVGNPSISPGIRRLAERAGLEGKIIRRSIDRLRGMGLLHVQRNDDSDSGINVISPHLSTLCEGVLGEERRGERKIAKRSEISHDAFRAGALGKDGPELLGFLRETIPLPFTRKAFPETFSTMYLRRVLPILEDAGLIVQVQAEAPKRRGRPEIFYKLTRPIRPSDLDRIAQAAGTAGAGEKQRARHQRERILYKSRFPEK